VRRNTAAEIDAFSLDKLDLGTLKLPAEAPVVITVNSRFDEMRIDAGTVGALKLPKNAAIDGLDTSNLIFRAFVTEPEGHKILASCESIRATEEDGVDRASLLFVHYGKLGERMWDMKLSDGDWPILRVNNNTDLDLRRHFETRDPFVRGLIVPQAFEQALVYLVFNPAGDEDPSKWQNIWTAFLEDRSIEIPLAPDSILDLEDLQSWARQTATQFANEVKFVTRSVEKKESRLHA
jgi:hypothetical protein